MIPVKNLDQLIHHKLSEHDAIPKGVDLASLNDLEQFLGIQLPHYYRDFLMKLGRSTHYISPWISLDFEGLRATQEHFRLLNASKGVEIKLPANALIIGNWQSVFDYIICDGVDDPAVFRVDVLQPDSITFGRRYPSCSSYLESLVNDNDQGSFSLDFFDQTDEPLNVTQH